jgi:creatinine amidohydrolase/Fe(II)-dependent formamide hydrolase-like protein
MQLKDVWPRIVTDDIQTAPSNPDAFQINVRVPDPEFVMQRACQGLASWSDYNRIARVHLALSTENDEPTTGVNGDPTKATPELGKMFIGFKIDNAVNQIHQLLAASKK